MKKGVVLILAVLGAAHSGLVASTAAVPRVQISAHVTDFLATDLFDASSAPSWLANPREVELRFELDPASLYVGPFGFAYSALGTGNLIVDGTALDAFFLYSSMAKTFPSPDEQRAALTGGGALDPLSPNADLQYVSYSLRNSTAAPFDFTRGFNTPLELSNFDLGGELIVGAFEPNDFLPVYRITASIDAFSLTISNPAAVPEPAAMGAVGAGLLLAAVGWRARRRRAFGPDLAAGGSEGA